MFRESGLGWEFGFQRHGNTAEISGNISGNLYDFKWMRTFLL